MLDENDTPNDQSDRTSSDNAASDSKPPRRRAAGRPAGPPKAAVSAGIFAAPVAQPKLEKAQPKTTQREKSQPVKLKVEQTQPDDAPGAESADAKPAKKAATKKTAAKKAAAKKAVAPADVASADESTAKPAKRAAPAGGLLFKAPEATVAPPRKRAAKPAAEQTGSDDASSDSAGSDSAGSEREDSGNSSSSNRDRDDDYDDDAPRRRRRSRGGRRRRKPEDGDESRDSNGSNDANTGDDNDEDEDGNPTLRRRRRRRAGEDSGVSPDDPENTTVRVREARSAEDEITSVSGSTRLEAKKQRRREGREAGRRRAPIVSEAEFLARRESVKREMAIRQGAEYTQIAVLEDNVLVEHYVARESQTSLIGNVYLAKVQNVLPSMEAAFVDIGKGRNAVLYAGEVDWTTLGNGKQRKIEDVLSSGQTILVQVTKDPIGQKGARLTSQISLAGRFLVYVPGGQTSGISRKLPDTERTRLKTLLKDVLPEDVGVIVRTAAEGATEDQLTRDVSALTARWEDIERKAKAGNSPELLYAEPDLMIKVVRDLFNEDFNRLVVEGDDAWDMVSGYIDHVAPDLIDRLEHWNGTNDTDRGKDVFSSLRVEEQISKALDRKVFLPSGGSLVIDRTEAMTVVDVNTGKFTGSGGNLEETVTKNNLEAAEEIVRQLRLRDIGGIIVIDFIDMVLESNRDLVLRRLVECLGRDRTRHQVAEVTSLGLVQMTRKRIGTGLLESFSTDCDHCHGRGVVIQTAPVEPADDANGRRNNRRGGGGGGGRNNGSKKNDYSDNQSNPGDKTADGMNPEDKGTANAADAPMTASKGNGNSRRSGNNRNANKQDAVKQDAPSEVESASASSDNGVGEVKPESSATSKSARIAGPGPDSADETKPDAKSARTEKTARVTENAVEMPVTDGPVLTGEGPAT